MLISALGTVVSPQRECSALTLGLREACPRENWGRQQTHWPGGLQPGKEVTSLEMTSRPQLQAQKKQQSQVGRAPPGPAVVTKGPGPDPGSAPGKLMHILLKPSPEIPPSERETERETLQTTPGACAPSGEHARGLPSSLSSPQTCVSWTLRAPTRLATRGAVGSGSLPGLNPQACPQGPLFSDFPVS